MISNVIKSLNNIDTAIELNLNEESLADFVQEEIILTPTKEQTEILSPETTENTETTDQQTVINMNLIDENLILLPH